MGLGGQQEREVCLLVNLVPRHSQEVLSERSQQT